MAIKTLGKKCQGLLAGYRLPRLLQCLLHVVHILDYTISDIASFRIAFDFIVFLLHKIVFLTTKVTRTYLFLLWILYLICLPTQHFKINQMYYMCIIIPSSLGKC